VRKATGVTRVCEWCDGVRAAGRFVQFVSSFKVGRGSTVGQRESQVCVIVATPVYIRWEWVVFPYGNILGSSELQAL